MTTPTAPNLSNDPARYPDPSNSATGPFYGRGVWELGEDGDLGTIVQGHDQRAYAALNAYCRALGLDRPRCYRPDDFPPDVRRRWATFRSTCGCTDAEHVEHRARIDTDAAEDAANVDCCEDITTEGSCALLPPCELEMYAWMLEYHDPAAGPVPDTAAPILVWS